MKRTGCMLLCCFMLFCAGCSFQPPDSAASEKSNTAVSKTSKTQSQTQSTPSVARQTGEGEDGLPAVIDGAEVSAPGQKSDTPKSQGSYIGNVNSKVFHKPDCALVKKMKSENKRAFSTRAEAFEAGFRPCSSCRP